MRQKLFYYLLLIISASSLTWLSCKKNIKDEPVATSVLPIPAATPVTGSVHGIVVDQNNNPVDAATIKIGTSTITTGTNGSFLFKNVTLDKYISTVTAEKAGFFKGIRSFSASATLNYVSIKLIPKTLSGSVASDNPAVVSLSNGTTINFQPNSIVVKSSGAAYNGQVNVYASYIDPTSADMSTMVPGSLIGQDANNLYALQSTGMIAVDLESPSGEALQLVSSMPASLKMPIPASLLSKAPATIDTWSLDDRGVWIKEGTATKNGDAYDMQVTHFSFWNCDVPINSTYLNIHLQDQNGNALVNTLVSLTIPNSNIAWSTSYGTTDSLGNVAGIIPSGTELELGVYSNPYNCSGPIYSQTIGPFTSSSTITVTATFSTSNILTVSGTATDCNGQPLANGTAIITYGTYSTYYTTITNGSYSMNITHCNLISSVNVTAVDATNGNAANSGDVQVGGNNSVTIPLLNACGGGTPTAVFTFGNGLGDCTIVSYIGQFITGTPLTGNTMVVINAYVTTPGTYSISTATINGITFTSSGTFTGTGTQPVALVASGTPVNVGNYTFTTQAAGVTGCPIHIPVNAPPAVLDLNSCTNINVIGTYMAGTSIGNTSAVQVTINVTTPGQYNLTATSNNGYSFQASGTVTTAGPYVFALYGSGVPNVPGTDNCIIQSAGIAGCNFPVTVLPNPNATYTFLMTGGQCSGATIAGSYIAGIPIISGNTVSLMVDVITTGAFSITTFTENGFYFEATGGNFVTTGPQLVTLTAYGTPSSSGTTTFTTYSNLGANGCTFTVQVN